MLNAVVNNGLDVVIYKLLSSFFWFNYCPWFEEILLSLRGGFYPGGLCPGFPNSRMLLKTNQLQSYRTSAAARILHAIRHKTGLM